MQIPALALLPITITCLLLSACRNAADSSTELTTLELGSTRNVHRMGEFIFAGQPGREDWATVSAMGVQTVISLRHTSELKDYNEKAVVTNAGMKFINIPFGSAEELSDDVFEKVRTHLKSAGQPVMLHCASANRVGAVWLPFRVLDEGVPYQQALLEAKQIGLRSTAYKQRIIEYLNVPDE